VHGTLHLFGYDHAEPDDAARMQRRERELLESFAAAESESASLPAPDQTEAVT
jgi:ssRNA-specific RNase YbeY (16S rRNA maturation enzyme)